MKQLSVPEQIVMLERAALDRWGAGDPSGLPGHLCGRCHVSFDQSRRAGSTVLADR